MDVSGEEDCPRPVLNYKEGKWMVGYEVHTGFGRPREPNALPHSIVAVQAAASVPSSFTSMTAL